MAAQSVSSPGSGGDKKPLGEGPELSEPSGQIAQNEDAHGSQTKVPFIPPEPMREDQVQNAVKFLSHPKVRGSPVIYRRSFLERKGLTKEEIDEAFRRVPDPPPNSTAADTVAANQEPKASASLQAQAPFNLRILQLLKLELFLWLQFTERTGLNWSHALLAVGLLSASGAGTAMLFKKAVLPRVKAWIRKVAIENNVSVKEDTNKSLAEETAEAAKAAASAAALVATASQELLNSKNQERKYFEAFMGMIDVQVKEMKSMSDAIQRLEKAKEQDKLVTEYAQYATANGTTNNSWRTSQVTQTDSLLNQVKVNGTTNTDYGAVKHSVTPTSVEPVTAPHSKSYMEIMEMVQRGEKPPNIREINDMPPNPNQPPSKPLIAPRTKPWEFPQQTSAPSPIENVQSKDVSSEPWWRRKTVQITELESELESTKHLPSSQRSWVPPQPPSVIMPEAAAAIRHPKPLPPPAHKQHSEDDKTSAVSGDWDGLAPNTSGPVVEEEPSASVPIAGKHNEIEEERDDGIQVM
ncbi:hypothetical protein HPP92_021465 [Vanilla planifolia]|uniref:Peroxisomal membrane protein PEX14 n=1 Tax=Vanilla planifolia TaxID=51239 RepID=A0A835Q4N5_VANPL|nr:hypothetical protein HPP92_021465 [Vanilla planifolia]